MAVDNVYVVSFTIWIAFEAVTGAEMKDIMNLKRKLFDEYDTQIRPVFDQREAINMNMTFTLWAIDSLDLKSQKLKWNGWLSLRWYDQGLSWNSSDFGDADFITVPQSQVWLPDFVVSNSVSSSRSLGSRDTLVFIRNSGHVTWEPGIVTETNCKIDIRKYPFDQQKCTFAFLPWMTTTRGLNTTSISDKIDLSVFIPHGEFEVMGSSVEVVYLPMSFVDDNLLGITYTIVLSRRPIFYLLNMIFPMMTFPLLCPISFLVPIECGEKITLSITVVLSFLVFIGSMNDAMPKLSDSVSLLVLYSSLQTSISILTVVANGIITCVSKLPQDFRFNLRYIMSRVKYKPGKVEQESNNSAKLYPQNMGTMWTLNQRVDDEASGKKHVKTETKGHNTEYWTKLARKMDKTCFVLIMSLSVLVSVTFVLLIF